MNMDSSRQDSPNSTGNRQRRGLGRGLGALIVDTQSSLPGLPSDSTTSGERTDPAERTGIRQIPIDAIAPNPHQPRSRFDPTGLEELAASIREHGILQPLIVTYDTESHPGNQETYWLVAGERRLRAARLAGLTEVPAIVRDTTTQQRLEWALVENLQRSDLNPLEEAAAYQQLVDEFSLTQAEIGQRVGKSRSAVANTMRLLLLPKPALDALAENRISAGHARALLALPNHDVLIAALERVLSRNLSVRQTEELVKNLIAAPTTPPTKADTDERSDEQAHISFLENRFRTALGTRVNLTRNADGSGRLVVHFYNDEDLDALVNRIAGPDVVG
jgi:ParB family chromosome partitioning protein